MKASETKFQPIVEGTKQYVVPLFQRAYSWDKKEWGVLWDDLVWLCENEEPKSHFIGSIVTMPTTSVPEGVTKYLLIDGQQRLTTIFIFLTLLRDLANQQDNQELAQEIEKTMLVNPYKKGLDYLKLLPTQIDRDYFQKVINGSLENTEHKIWSCYQFFERKLKQTSISVEDLTHVVIKRLSVVSIVLDYDDNPHLVFESLNAKGRPLTQADLIRNYFLMRIHIDQQEEIHESYWKPMQQALEENLTECIRHYLMSNGSIVKQSDIYFTLKDRIGQSDALNALKEIFTFATYYEKLVFPERESQIELRVALQRLNRLEVTTAYPFLLNCYHDYHLGNLSVEKLLLILQTLENYLIRRYVCNVATSQLNKIFPPLHQQATLDDSRDLLDAVRYLLQSRGYPKDSEFRARLLDAKLYGAGERLIKTKLLLETLEEAYNHKEQPTFANTTIEHIMPQTPTEWWKNNLGDEWESDHELYLHCLGNLTITGYNPELSNADFYKKKSILIGSNFQLNKYFRDINQWNTIEIEARSNKLADLALEIWEYFGEERVEVAEVSDENSITGKIPAFLEILGQQFDVKSWRDVEAMTLDTIAELEPDLFVKLAEQYPRFIALDPSRFRANRQLSNGYYIEVNLSAKDIYRFCTQAMDTLGLSSDEWFVSYA